MGSPSEFSWNWQSMTKTRNCAHTIFISLMLAASSAHAFIVETYPVQLSSKDRTAVIHAACKRNSPPATADFSAYRYVDRRAEPIHASVTCAARRTRDNEVVRSIAECNNESGRWQCNDLGDLLEVKVDRRTVHVPVGEHSTRNAAEMARFLLSIQSYDGISISQAIDGATCLFSARSLDTWEASCGRVRIMVAQDCGDGKCSYRAFGDAGIWID